MNQSSGNDPSPSLREVSQERRPLQRSALDTEKSKERKRHLQRWKGCEAHKGRSMRDEREEDIYRSNTTSWHLLGTASAQCRCSILIRWQEGLRLLYNKPILLHVSKLCRKPKNGPKIQLTRILLTLHLLIKSFHFLSS
jgi:hypothetical protein